MLQKKIQQQDLLSFEKYEQEREQYRLRLIEIKKNRRLAVGPDIIFHFENEETIRFQIQEMLYIEKGGADQAKDELEAYNPLVPQGNNLTATMMIEIPEEEKRKERLLQLGHIEQMVVLQLNKEEIPATSIDQTERTTQAGKTSAVHFLNFQFTENQKNLFKQLETSVKITITHPHYHYEATFAKELKQSLITDLS